ncbi:7905_t:CDS:2, partial [Acaulospora colombiana]
ERVEELLEQTTAGGSEIYQGHALLSPSIRAIYTTRSALWFKSIAIYETSCAIIVAHEYTLGYERTVWLTGPG